MYRCPTPGCDGSGHVNGQFPTHRTPIWCPLMARNKASSGQPAITVKQEKEDDVCLKKKEKKSPSSIVTGRRANREVAQCLTPGCNGKGHISGLYTKHNTVYGCPNLDKTPESNSTTSQPQSILSQEDGEDNSLPLAGQPWQCPTPGCDSSGHISGKRPSHRSAATCPRANTPIEHDIKQENDENNSLPLPGQPWQCPTPGCDGSGHISGKRPSHRSAAACPKANTPVKCEEEQEAKPNISDINGEIEALEDNRTFKSVWYCPTPGCDGSGHISGKRPSHRSAAACPKANTPIKREEEQEAKPNISDIEEEIEALEDNRTFKSAWHCPTPGCDGSGHVSGKRPSHRSAATCPKVNTPIKHEDAYGQDTKSNISDTEVEVDTGTVKNGPRDQDHCQTPGCDGLGHASGLYKKHFSVRGCPNVARVKARDEKPKHSPNYKSPHTQPLKYRCIVPGCSSSKFGLGCKHLGFGKLPWQDPAILRQWLIKLTPDTSKLTRQSLVCSLHFEDHCCDQDFGAHLLGRKAKKKIKPGTVPTRHLPVKLEIKSENGEVEPEEEEDYFFDEHIERLMMLDSQAKHKKVAIECGHCSFVATSIPFMQKHMVNVHNYTDIEVTSENDGDDDDVSEEEEEERNQEDDEEYTGNWSDTSTGNVCKNDVNFAADYVPESVDDMTSVGYGAEFFPHEDNLKTDEKPEQMVTDEQPFDILEIKAIEDFDGDVETLAVKLEETGCGPVEIKTFDDLVSLSMLPPVPTTRQYVPLCRMCDVDKWGHDYELLAAHLLSKHRLTFNPNDLREQIQATALEQKEEYKQEEELADATKKLLTQMNHQRRTLINKEVNKIKKQVGSLKNDKAVSNQSGASENPQPDVGSLSWHLSQPSEASGPSCRPSALVTCDSPQTETVEISQPENVIFETSHNNIGTYNNDSETDSAQENETTNCDVVAVATPQNSGTSQQKPCPIFQVSDSSCHYKALKSISRSVGDMEEFFGNFQMDTLKEENDSILVYMCNVCKFSGSYDGIKSHLKVHFSTLKFALCVNDSKLMQPIKIIKDNSDLYLYMAHKMNLMCLGCFKNLSSQARLLNHCLNEHSIDVKLKSSMETCSSDHTYSQNDEGSVLLLTDHKRLWYGTYYCTFCNQRFHSAEYFRSHVKRQHHSLLYYCAFCTYVASCRERAQVHSQEFHTNPLTEARNALTFALKTSSKVSKCPHCDFVTDNLILALKHSGTHQYPRQVVMNSTTFEVVNDSGSDEQREWTNRSVTVNIIKKNIMVTSKVNIVAPAKKRRTPKTTAKASKKVMQKSSKSETELLLTPESTHDDQANDYKWEDHIFDAAIKVEPAWEDEIVDTESLFPPYPHEDEDDDLPPDGGFHDEDFLPEWVQTNTQMSGRRQMKLNSKYFGTKWANTTASAVNVMKNAAHWKRLSTSNASTSASSFLANIQDTEVSKPVPTKKKKVPTATLR